MLPRAHPVPDPRLVDRLVDRLRIGHDGAAAWIAGGEALAMAIATSPSPDRLPLWADRLADAMVGSLLRVQDQTMDDAGPEERVGLGLAAAVLSTLRPRAIGACDAAISTWIGWSAGSPRALTCPDMLAGWAVLALLLRDPERATDAVDALVDLDPGGLGFLLYDWTVVVLQEHGFARQAQAFHHFRTAMRASGVERPMLLVTAALVLVDAAGQPRQRVVGWLNEVARELETQGTACSSPVPAARR